MENNNNPQYTQQTGYQPPYGVIDPSYNNVVKEFLTKAIVSCAISSLPIGSIIALVMASKNRAAILDYLSKGGYHTMKIKVCSALSRAGKYAGIAYTILWAFYILFYVSIFAFMIFGVLANAGRR
ncbi:MAG: hypothetical protein J5777_07630 [Clostridiales bacterium]|nr:hypothetical protein [Clostridiales bacterium]